MQGFFQLFTIHHALVNKFLIIFFCLSVNPKPKTTIEMGI